MRIFDREELAWAAGFFDGEGCTSLDARRPEWACARLSIGQAVDLGREHEIPAVLIRFQRAVGDLGGIGKCGYRAQPHHKVRYMWHCASLEQVQAVIALLWHWLSPVKRAQATLRFEVAITSRANRRPLRVPPLHSGEDHPHAKLTWSQVREIRARHARGESQADLSRALSIADSHISRIILNKIWREEAGAP